MSNDQPPPPSHGPQGPHPFAAQAQYPQPPALHGAPPAYPYAYGGFPGVPPQMPGSVKAARVLIFVLAGFFVLGLLFVAGLGGGPREFGAVTGSNITVIAMFVMALRFTTAGHGVRVACIVLSSLQTLLALGAVGNGAGPGGVISAGMAIALVILFSQGSAGQWFKRPRTPEQFPQGYAAS